MFASKLAAKAARCGHYTFFRRSEIAGGFLLLPFLLVPCAPIALSAQSITLQQLGAESASLPAGPLGPNDLLQVSVYGVPGLSRPARVSTEGEITLPMLPEPIRAEGLLPQDLEPVIAKAFERAGILVDPIITVTVTEYRSRPITVSGAVKVPLTFQAAGPVTLLEAIAKANGLTPEAGPEIIVSYPKTADSERPDVRISAPNLMDGREGLNLSLSGGENIRVPASGKVFVLGNVKKPGAFRSEDPTDTSVLRVLAMSEGLAPFASKTAYVYRAQADGSPRTEIPIELRQIIERKQPDVTLQANDILYIPDDKHRRITVNTLERLAAFGAGTASGVIIWH
jgi:polysaccharide biosynthesis/export protein